MTTYDSLLVAAPTPESLSHVPTLPPFDGASIAFIEALSGSLLCSPAVRAYPELVALAFWMRKANIERIRADVGIGTQGHILVPRGTAFHIAPSNVDTIFVYSWFISLLVGNRNIVRLPSKQSPQIILLLSTILELLSDATHTEIFRRTLLVRYAPSDMITARFSAQCDIRVVWGGDETVHHIRTIPIPPTSLDIAFASKFSLALMDAQRWSASSEQTKQEWVSHFYNDAYWFDQMACSSPRMFIWIGDKNQAFSASKDFWPRLEAILESRQQRFSDIDYVNKRVASDVLAMSSDVSVLEGQTNDLVRIWCETASFHEQEHCGAGLFMESVIPTLSALRPLLSRKVQTITYAGLTRDEIQSFVTEAPISGIDRFVPFGQALDFSPIWDGFDLPRTFMREITIT